MTKKTRAVVLTGPHRLEIREFDLPEVGDVHAVACQFLLQPVDDDSARFRGASQDPGELSVEDAEGATGVDEAVAAVVGVNHLVVSLGRHWGHEHMDTLRQTKNDCSV